MTTDHEIYFCANCLSTGPLNLRGRCEMCGSDAVDTVEKLGPHAAENHELTWLDLGGEAA